MIDITRAIQLGWVEHCRGCKPIWDAAHALEDASRQARSTGLRCRALGLGSVQIDCELCGGRGWLLTADGQQLVDLVQELYPELVIKKPEEIPF